MVFNKIADLKITTTIGKEDKFNASTSYFNSDENNGEFCQY